MALHHELIKKQNEGASAQLDAVKFKRKDSYRVKDQQSSKHNTNRPKFSKNKSRSGDSRQYKKTQQSKNCGKCGRNHTWGNCPAFGKKCFKCQKNNHFGKMCKNKQIQEVEESSSTRHYFIGSITADVPPWTTSIEILGKMVKFKIDTGADVNIINRETWNYLGKPTLENTDSQLLSPAGRVSTLGKFTIKIDSKTMIIFVISSNSGNLLSRTTASNMGLVKLVNSVKTFSKVQCDPVKIKLKPNTQPFAVPVARRVPIPLMEKVEKELQRMKETDIIEEINDPTDWVSPMVPVVKPSGEVRICVDLKKLNENVERERYIMPTMDDIIYKLKDSGVFSKLDAASGYHQIPLEQESAKLTTFITPMGRYYFKRLPFGISSGPEIFQKIMEKILTNIEGVICYMDDILVHSKDENSHTSTLLKVKEKLQEAGLQLNEEKCAYHQKELKFLGHIVSQHGVRPDPEKVNDIKKMAEPKDIPELRRFLGMVQYLGRYIKDLSTILSPLNQLLQKETAWYWGPDQTKAFQTVKDRLTDSRALAYFDIKKETVVSADASSFGIGAVLLQKHNEDWKPVAFCSRTLTKTEKMYAQIEKECLASTWACERFEKYLVGLETFILHTDHKPLVPLINKKQLIDCPLRCQRLLMRLMRFKVKAVHIPGKDMVVADTLSRSPQEIKSEENELQDKVLEYVGEIVSAWPISDAKIRQIQEETQKDVCLSATMDYTCKGWPRYREDVKLAALTMYPYRGELSVVSGILTKGDRMLIPVSMRKEILGRIHEGHFGITKCRERANLSVWWPNISQDIKDMVSKCKHCIEKKPTQRKEPLLPSELPDRPFQKVGVDLCEYKKESYLVMEDYYSRYLEILYLPHTTSQTVIGKLKTCFARYGIPNMVVSDNAQQFKSREFQKFSEEWNFNHVTSSPRFPQSNGKAERAVKTAKEILSQDDSLLAILAYRSTPLVELGISPAELAFGRKIRNTLPCLPHTLEPKQIDKKDFIQRDTKAKMRQKKNFDSHHGARHLPELKEGETVLVKTDLEKNWKTPAKVVKKVAPRSYLVRTEKQGELRRNRRHLYKVPQDIDYQVPRRTMDLDTGEDVSSNPPSRSYPTVATPAEVENEETRSPTSCTPETKTLNPPEVKETGPRRSAREVKAPKRLICEQ